MNEDESIASITRKIEKNPILDNTVQYSWTAYSIETGNYSCIDLQPDGKDVTFENIELANLQSLIQN